MNKLVILTDIERELDFQENLDPGRVSEFNDILYKSLFESYLGVVPKEQKNHHRMLLNVACISRERLNHGGQNA